MICIKSVQHKTNLGRELTFSNPGWKSKPCVAQLLYLWLLNPVSMKTITEATRIHTSPTALTLFPRTNIPIGIPLRLGQLLTLWPEGPVFTTLYTPGPPRRNGISGGSCITASWGQCEFRSLKKSSALDLDSWKFQNKQKKIKKQKSC